VNFRRVLSIAAFDARAALRNGSAWLLVALAMAMLAWGFLHNIDAFNDGAEARAALSDAPGVGELITAPHLANAAWLLLLLAPLLTLRSIGEEYRRGTLEALLASGVRPLEVVLGKWLGANLLLAPVVALTIAMAASLAAGSTFDPGRLFAGAVGLTLAGAALTAIGVAASACFRHPALAAAGAYAAEFFIWLVDAPARARGTADGLINFLAMPTHLGPFLRGVLSAGDAVWFMALVFLALAIAWRRVRAFEARG